MRVINLPVAGMGMVFLLTPGVSLRAEEAFQEQVLVTATRVPEDAGRMPLAWSAVDDESLLLVGPVHINEIMQRVPGVWIARGNGQESLPSLRSPVLTGAGSCGAFFMAADGISLRAPGFCNVNQLFDANFEQAGRIEVIKGPAPALYGSNAMHGVINVLSAAPTEDPDHEASLEAGPHDYFRAGYHYRNTLGEHGLSINLNGSTDGGYKDDSGYDQQKLTLRHDYTGEDWSFTSVLDAANLNQETAGYIEGYKAYQDEDLKKSNPNPEAYRDARSMRLYSSASRELDEDSTLTITPYLRDNQMKFLMHFVPWQPVEENGHRSLGLRATLHTTAAVWHWVNGMDFEYTDGWLKEVQADDFSPNQPAGVHYDYEVVAGTAAAFSQVNADIDDRWSMSAGVRLEYTNYDYDNRTDDGSACAPEATACRFYRPADRQDDFSDWTLNVGVTRSLGDRHRAYARMARGFRAPQTSELYRLQSGQTVADLDSEQIDSVEFGLRGEASRWAYDLSLYYMLKDEVIFQDRDRQNVSGARTRHTGLEISADYRLSADWYLGIDATYARHTYDNRALLLGAGEDIKGNDIDSAPRYFGSARLGWDWSALSGQDSRAELEWIYLDEYYVDPDNEHRYDGHSLLNLRVSSSLGDSWQTTLRLTNLLDEDYAERADFGFGEYRYFVGEPLAAYLEVAYRFGVR